MPRVRRSAGGRRQDPGIKAAEPADRINCQAGIRPGAIRLSTPRPSWRRSFRHAASHETGIRRRSASSRAEGHDQGDQALPDAGTRAVDLVHVDGIAIREGICEGTVVHCYRAVLVENCYSDCRACFRHAA